METSAGKSTSEIGWNSPAPARSSLSVPELRLEPFLSNQNSKLDQKYEYSTKLRSRPYFRPQVSIVDLQSSLARFELEKTASYVKSTTVVYKS